MQRRNFLELLAAGTLGVYAAPLLGNDAKSKKLALQLYSVRDAVAKDLEGTLSRLVAMGYDTIEIYGYNGTFFGKTPAEFSAILKRTGVKVVSSHHLTGISMKGKGSLTDGWKQAVEDIHSIGGKYMACAFLFPDERTDAVYGSLPEMLTKAGEETKTAGIQFAYHNHDFEFKPFRDTLVYDFILNNTPADLVKMELDLYWISKAGYDPIKYFEKYPGRFPLWHVKDMAKGSGDITEVGNGEINFDAIFAARKTAGMKHWFVEQDVSKGDMFESLKSSYAYLKKKGYK
jgi:sugar phosphate isomerase/epimerase